MQKLIHWASLIALTLGLYGCAGLRTMPEKPDVSLAGLELIKAGLFEQEFLIKLRVHNPNSFAIPVDGVDVKLDLNGQPFVKALSNQQVSIPKYSSTVIELKAVSTISTLGAQVKTLLNGKNGAINYNLNGKVHLIDPVISMPVAKEGSVTLGDFLP